MVHESDDGLQGEGLQAAAAGQQIWVLVGPGLAVCREEASGERWGGARLGVRTPKWRGETRRSKAKAGEARPFGERGTHRRVPVHAGARAGDARRAPGQRGTYPRVSIHAGAKAGDVRRVRGREVPT